MIKETETSTQYYAKHYWRASKAKIALDKLVKAIEEKIYESVKTAEFDESDYSWIIIDSCFTCIEAFIDHVGFMLDNDWCDFEGKNFYKQYGRLIFIFKENKIEVDEKQAKEKKSAK